MTSTPSPAASDADGVPAAVAAHRRPRYLGVVFAGGMAGTLLRYLAQVLAGPRAGEWAVLGINLTGAFCLGLLLELLARRGPETEERRLLRLCLGTGLLGSFTTYSTFAVDAVSLAMGNIPALLGYLAASLGGGLLAAWAGVAVAARLQGRTG